MSFLIILLLSQKLPAVFEVSSNHKVLLGVICWRGSIITASKTVSVCA
jgi:hypothetical protein